jgi:Glycoside hydrolase 97.
MRILMLLAIITLFAGCKKSNNPEAVSPNSKLKMVVEAEDSIRYKVLFNGKEVVSLSPIGLRVRDKMLTEHARIKNVQYNSVQETIEPLYGKFKSLSNHYNETIIEFEEDISLILRAYDEGVAYRWITGMEGEIIVENEEVAFNIADKNAAVVYPETGNYTSWELMYIDYADISSVPVGKKAITPVLYSMPDGVKVVVAESDVRDYPGMYLVKEGIGFTGNFAPYPDSVALGSWGNFVSVVQTRKGYIAQTSGKREFPWRIIMVTDDDKSLLTNELVYKLAKPQVPEDVSWIKPGKAAWEWWHDAMLPGEDIPSGMDNRNTELYKRYIDFASKYKLEYLMIDAGWSNIFDLSKVNPKTDVKEIIDYGKSKDVGVFLWCVATALTDSTVDRYMQMLKDWGAVGLKVDFFDRDDQPAMNWYENIASKAAEYKLMINFHGCSKPTGLLRTYPNIVNFEAVRGAECSKWDLTANPQHHLLVPFTRMLCGPLDYTPGAMRNRSPQLFKPVDPGLPLAQGTRCHELAMFVVFDQYLAMLCDSPSEYEKEPDIMKFLSDVPVTFDSTIALDAKVGEYAVLAKQKNNTWYVGGMTNWKAREVIIDFSFLPSGKEYTVDIYRDSPDANLYADQYIYETKQINTQTKLPVLMAGGGGTAMKIYLKQS